MKDRFDLKQIKFFCTFHSAFGIFGIKQSQITVPAYFASSFTTNKTLNHLANTTQEIPDFLLNKSISLSSNLQVKILLAGKAILVPEIDVTSFTL